MSWNDALENYFAAAIKTREGELAAASSVLAASQERWRYNISKTFVQPQSAIENIHRSIERHGSNATMEMIEYSGIRDAERGWVDVKTEIGPMRTGDEDSEAERAIYQIRESWIALQQHTRQVERAERALRLIRLERDRRLAEAERMRTGGARPSDDRQISQAADAESAIHVDGHSRQRNSRA